MPAHVTEADARDYRECGVAVIRNALTPELVDTLRRSIDHQYKGSDIDPNCTAKEKKVFDRFPCYRNHPEYNEVIFRSDIPKIAAQLTGSNVIRFHHEQIHAEIPSRDIHTLWHSDELFYNVSGNQNLTIFVVVDPMPSGDAEFVLGSHKWPATMPRYLRDRYAKDLPVGAVPEPPNVEASRRVLPIVSWDLKPGDCLAFSFRTLHWLKAATALRRGISIRYLGDDAVYTPRSWTTFPHFPELEKDVEGMKAGGPMRHSIFPIAYAAESKL